MFDHLFIAEKASLAQEVAEARAQQLGVKASRARTHWEVGPDAVCALSGHMYEPAPPDAYDPRFKSWSIPDLPIVPERWKLVIGKDRDGKPKDAKVKEIRELIKQARNIVNVGDPGREGQLLVDEVLVEARVDPFGSNVMRLWITDLSASKKVEALKAMAPNADRRTLYESALSRQRADWLHGMNMTRLYTVLARQSGARDAKLSVGRVQTPTLRIVVDRDREIAKFKAVDHFLPTGTFRHADGTFAATWIIPKEHDGLDSEGRLVDRSVAERVANKVKGKTGPVESYEVKKKSKAPPLPYSLTQLEKECSAKFGFDVEKTDGIAQALYETHKVASYPRTDCRHLPTGVLAEEAPTILRNLGGVPAYSGTVERADPSLKSGAWDDKKVAESDAGHYAIMPTMEATASKLAALSDDERKVFDLVAKAFLAQFYPDHRWDSTTAVVAIEGERFKGTGRKVTDTGWKAVYGQVEKEEDEDEDEQDMPRMQRGDPVTAEQTSIASKRTSPPPKFTEGTLVEAMENIHKFVPDGEMKSKLRANSGIGTSATRGPTIKTLKDRKFLVTKGKFIVSTELGGSLIDVLDERHKDPALTALWEDQIKLVNAGKLPMDRFLGVLVQDLRATVQRLSGTRLKIAGAAEPLPGDGETCDKCGTGVMRTKVAGPKSKYAGKSYLSCSNWKGADDPTSCNNSRWPASGDGKPVEPLPGHGTTCPTCRQGTLSTKMWKDKRYLSCSNWKGKDDPTSCKHVQWEEAPVKPMKGHGDPCPKCGLGKLKTIEIPSGKHKGLRFLQCDKRVRDDETTCQHRQFEAVAPLPGDGDPCPSCKVGKKKTIEYGKAPDTKKFMVCTENRRGDETSCQWKEWPREKIDPLPGDGDLCEKCAAGRMRTRISQKAEGPEKRFLSCDGYRKGDDTSCRHAVFPDRNLREVKGNGKPAPGQGARKAPSKGRASAGR